MESALQKEDSDQWSEWLCHRRHGGSATYDQSIQIEVLKLADKVVAGAQLRPGQRMLDVGTGTGLVAFRALETMCGQISVIGTDISPVLIRYTQKMANQQGWEKQCIFKCSAADDLAEIENESIDAVTTRSALAYVADKPRALREMFRVLRPGGRISFAEPIMRDEAILASSLRSSIEQGRFNSDADAVFVRLLHRWKSAQYPDTREKIAAAAHTNFSERDLLRYVQDAGFKEIHLELHIDVEPAISISWDAFLHSSPHPLAPTTAEILSQRFTPEEGALFETWARPLIEQNKAISFNYMTFIQAKKPF